MVSNIGTEPQNFSFYAMAIIITTVIFKIILLPVNLHQSKSSKKMNEIQPKNEKKFKINIKMILKLCRQKMAELYKEHNYNPAAGCLSLLIQFPIILCFF